MDLKRIILFQVQAFGGGQLARPHRFKLSESIVIRVHVDHQIPPFSVQPACTPPSPSPPLQLVH
jgi:hypothetical protein